MFELYGALASYNIAQMQQTDCKHFKNLQLKGHGFQY